MILQNRPKRILDALYEGYSNSAVRTNSDKLSGEFDSLVDNNYTNVKYSKHQIWQGQEGHKDGFVVFTDPEYSIRAFYRILKAYSKRNLTTVKQIAHEYAPLGDGSNDPSKYVKEFLKLMKEQFQYSPISSESSLATKYYPYLAKTFVFLETSKDLPIEYFTRIYKKYEHD